MTDITNYEDLNQIRFGVSAQELNNIPFTWRATPSVADLLLHPEQTFIGQNTLYPEQEERVVVNKKHYESLVEDSERLQSVENSADSYRKQRNDLREKLKLKNEKIRYKLEESRIPKSAFDHPFGYLAQEDFLLKLLDEE